jgi:hypothetical protein
MDDERFAETKKRRIVCKGPECSIQLNALYPNENFLNLLYLFRKIKHDERADQKQVPAFGRFEGNMAMKGMLSTILHALNSLGSG